MSDDFADSLREPDDARSTWLPPLAWSLFILLALIAFELTAQPAVSAVVLCCKFGWNDLRTGVWLRRRDPWPARGRACSWFCFAWALAKIALAAFVSAEVVFVLIHVIERNGPAPVNPPNSFIGVALLLLIAMPVAAFFAAVGCVVARRGRIRVWIDPSLHRARETGHWPPEFTEPRQDDLSNRAAWARAAMLAVMFVLNLTLCVVLVLAFHPVLSIVVGGAGLIATIALCTNTVARHPAECWGIARALEFHAPDSLEPDTLADV
jgi:hypothetical protein